MAHFCASMSRVNRLQSEEKFLPCRGQICIHDRGTNEKLQLNTGLVTSNAPDDHGTCDESGKVG